MSGRCLVFIFLMTLGAMDVSAIQPDHRMSNSVVQIQGAESGGRLYFGSGVIVAPKIVATNCHVVRTGGRIGIFRGYRSYRVEGVRADVRSDLCLLDVPALDLHPARLASIGSLKKGDALYFYGFPRALGLSYTDGKVLRTRHQDGLPLIETSAFFTLGGSGGGLFDRRGRLVGLATYIDRGHGGGYYAIGSDLIAQVMKRPRLPIAPLTGSAFWETASVPAQGSHVRD
ncbi:MAG: hypothetical protein RLZZ627_388 [Pseudomonadota bacterium]|jgi:S1-C subfamily serine protease